MCHAFIKFMNLFLATIACFPYPGPLLEAGYVLRAKIKRVDRRGFESLRDRNKKR